MMPPEAQTWEEIRPYLIRAKKEHPELNTDRHIGWTIQDLLNEFDSASRKKGAVSGYVESWQREKSLYDSWAGDDEFWEIARERWINKQFAECNQRWNALVKWNRPRLREMLRHERPKVTRAFRKLWSIVERPAKACVSPELLATLGAVTRKSLQRLAVILRLIKAIRDLPLLPSKKNPRVRRHQRPDKTTGEAAAIQSAKPALIGPAYELGEVRLRGKRRGRRDGAVPILRYTKHPTSGYYNKYTAVFPGGVPGSKYFATPRSAVRYFRNWRKLSAMLDKGKIPAKRYWRPYGDLAARVAAWKLQRMPQIVPVEPEEFVRMRERNARRAFLSSYSAEDYRRKRIKLFRVAGKEAGAALTPDGDAISLFNNEGEGLGLPLFLHQIRMGAKTLDCVGDWLASYYRTFGFVESRREPNWTKGEQDVICTAYEGGTQNTKTLVRRGRTGRSQRHLSGRAYGGGVRKALRYGYDVLRVLAGRSDEQQRAGLCAAPPQETPRLSEQESKHPDSAVESGNAAPVGAAFRGPTQSTVPSQARIPLVIAFGKAPSATSRFCHRRRIRAFAGTSASSQDSPAKNRRQIKTPAPRTGPGARGGSVPGSGRSCAGWEATVSTTSRSRIRLTLRSSCGNSRVVTASTSTLSVSIRTCAFSTLTAL